MKTKKYKFRIIKTYDKFYEQYVYFVEVRTFRIFNIFELWTCPSYMLGGYSVWYKNISLTKLKEDLVYHINKYKKEKKLKNFKEVVEEFEMVV